MGGRHKVGGGIQRRKAAGRSIKFELYYSVVSVVAVSHLHRFNLGYLVLKITPDQNADVGHVRPMRGSAHLVESRPDYLAVLVAPQFLRMDDKPETQIQFLAQCGGAGQSTTDVLCFRHTVRPGVGESVPRIDYY